MCVVAEKENKKGSNTRKNEQSEMGFEETKRAIWLVISSQSSQQIYVGNYMI